MRGPLDVARSAARTLGRHLPHAEPPPVLPPDWATTVLAGPLAVDIERWRRFQGEITRTDEVSGAEWTLTLRRGLAHDAASPGAWWRGEADDIVVELAGYLQIAEPGRDPVAFPASLELVRWRGGKHAAELELASGNWRVQRSMVQLERRWPVREGVPASAGPPTNGIPDTDAHGWTGFPTEPVTLRVARPIEALVGMRANFSSLVDAVRLPDDAAHTGYVGVEEARFEHDLPDELLFTAWQPDDQTVGVAGERFVVRVSSEQPFGYATPEYVGRGARWNPASSLDLDCDIERVERGDGVVTLAGTGWRLHLVGQALEVRVEPLA